MYLTVQLTLIFTTSTHCQSMNCVGNMYVFIHCTYIHSVFNVCCYRFNPLLKGDM